MDGSLNDAGNAMAALVVRQFTPSRIEHQLLAQVFDLVCGRQCAVEESHSMGQQRDSNASRGRWRARRS